MPPKMGRPVMGESKKDAQIAFRVSPEIVKKFDECRTLSGKTKVLLFEEMVNKLHDELTKEK